MSTGRALQALNNVQLNAKATPSNGIIKTPVRSSISKPETKTKKKKEKLSSLCKTPPSVVRTRNGRGYHRGLFLGEGGFARCFQMKDESGRIFAAKTVAKASIKNEKTKTKLLSEIKIHKSMSHPNIVQFVDCFEDDVNVYILLEICPNQSLMDLLKARKVLSEPEVRLFMVQIIGAIKYLHRRRVVHRDLKLGNIFFDPDMNVKIGDFGLATVVSPSTNKRYTICGTPNYIAPEVLGGKATGHSFEVDIWAIGIMMFALLFGKPPFQAKDVQVIYERIKNNEYKFPADSSASAESKNLITKLLSTDPALRPSLDEILEHEWFKCGPFPAKISTESLKQIPKNLAFITKEESLINFATCKQRVGINDSYKSPVEILKTDLESEQPKTLLPHSLSPNNTKNKYKEIPPVAVRNTVRSRITNELANAHPENQMMRILNDTLSATLMNMKEIEEQKLRPDARAMKKPIVVSKWVDYSNKHGFSYQLSSGAIGVLFNAGQTVLKMVDTTDVFYISSSSEEGWKVAHYTEETTPPLLSREIEVVDFFRKYMTAHLSDVASGARKSSSRSKDVFLRRYTRDDNYIMFELSNGSYQFNFKDHHKMVISELGQYLTHITPSKEIETLPLDYVLSNGNFYESPDEYFSVKYDFMKHALRDKISI
ncbi:hypothetical protein KL905_000494 [Ogataea polymorpha]|uniref:Serine/threonine-protein kinase n=2 Tax=Ogataea polymorpha TaxID=460523 RepID=A0A9P8P113_9ASCO|nr:hypothetical protein KL937_000583 [Ogataea polymorpha]KAG7895257.1 hypothetical protein KL908_001607 [Ogataea polymorpha]KAG7902261.1 hypothetical protein KL935_001169 [Ogataea polymorpha]KAG7911751.1 hypothetical protein KL906_001072 [Ogataea polymorpha]KAG7912413.1 hypothetical protein KL907_000615 [Ogataea polymorpha]